MNLPPRFLAVALILALSACSKSEKTTAAAEPHASHDHAAPANHAHTAPRGGTLVEIGDHAYNIELLRDPAAGKLTAWILDAHAENYVRVKATVIALVAMPGGKFTPLTLTAVANPATGETVGDTSQFEVQADWLKTAGAFAGILTVEIKGTTFAKVEYSLAQ